MSTPWQVPSLNPNPSPEPLNPENSCQEPPHRTSGVLLDRQPRGFVRRYASGSSGSSGVMAFAHNPNFEGFEFRA